MTQVTAPGGGQVGFDAAIADAYRDASLAGADMRDAADRIEAVRSLTRQ